MSSKIFQSHVKSSAVTDLEKTELFTRTGVLSPKENAFIESLYTKATSAITLKESKKLKEIARKHIDAPVRSHLWILLSGGAEFKKKNPSLYTETYEHIFSKGDFIPDGMDDNREFLTYYLTTDGGRKLRQVMYIIHFLNPDITFCPLMEPIVSLLLHFMDESDCFACISGLLANEAVPFLTQTNFDNIAADATLQDLFKQKKRFVRLESFVQSQPNDSKSKLVLFPLWRRMIFEKLDFVSLVRVLDCLIVEGSKSLYRVGLYLLDVFYEYSLAFRKFDCSSPHDLLATIGQYTVSRNVSSDEILKVAMKIDITTKQIEKYAKENFALHKEGRLEHKKQSHVTQVVAVDLNEISDIIKPSQWCHVCQWLPARIQIQQPYLLFSTNKDGYNLKTLYLLCEDEEQTLLVLQTTKKEIFGAYLSCSLLERHNGRTNMSYFGTGETFLFTLSPKAARYCWVIQNKNQLDEPLRKCKYIFVETTPHLEKGKEEVDANSTKTRRKSLKRTFSRQSSKSARVSRDESHQISLINIKRNAESVPRHLFLGQSVDLLDHPDDGDYEFSRKISSDRVSTSVRKKPLNSATTFDENFKRQLSRGKNVTEADGNEIFAENNATIKSSTSCVTDEYDVIEEDAPLSTVEKNVIFQVGDNKVAPCELFISCDNSRLIVGGGGGDGLSIDGEIQKGRSEKCYTFLNEPLSSEDNGDFIVARLDVFGFR